MKVVVGSCAQPSGEESRYIGNTCSRHSTRELLMPISTGPWLSVIVIELQSNAVSLQIKLSLIYLH